MSDAAIPDGRRLYEAPRATSAPSDPLLAETGLRFDRWVVPNAHVTESVPAEVGLLESDLDARFDT